MMVFNFNWFMDDQKNTKNQSSRMGGYVRWANKKKK